MHVQKIKWDKTKFYKVAKQPSKNSNTVKNFIILHAYSCIYMYTKANQEDKFVYTPHPGRLFEYHGRDIHVTKWRYFVFILTSKCQCQLATYK